MKILVLGAAGAMALTTIKDLLQSPAVSKIVLADFNDEKLRMRVELLSDSRLQAMRLDIRNVDEVSSLMGQVDVTINAAYFEFNLLAMKAAIKAKVPLIDLGGLYHVTKKQLELDPEVRKAGILVIPGIGSDPGTSNVLCKYGADRLDDVEEIHIRYGSKFSGLTFVFAVGTIIQEAAENAIIYENGEYKEIAALSTFENTLFRDPIGELKTYSILHSELATIPKFIKGVKKVTYQDSWDASVIEKVNILRSLNLLSRKQMIIKNINTTPIEMIIELFSELTKDEKPSEGWDSLKVTVAGRKNNKETAYVLEVMSSGDNDAGITPTSHLTGTPPSIVAQMIAKNEIAGIGVLPPEACIPPKKYFDELIKRDIRFYETVSQTESR